MTDAPNLHHDARPAHRQLMRAGEERNTGSCNLDHACRDIGPVANRGGDVARDDNAELRTKTLRPRPVAYQTTTSPSRELAEVEVEDGGQRELAKRTTAFALSMHWVDIPTKCECRSDADKQTSMVSNALVKVQRGPCIGRE